MHYFQSINVTIALTLRSEGGPVHSNAALSIDIPLLFDGDITIPVGRTGFGATLTIPLRATGLVVFVHGGPSSNRYNARNQEIAAGLNGAGLATLLIDLLTSEEEAMDWRMSQLLFDVYLLGARVKAITEWAKNDGALAHLPLGYLGAGTGAAAAFIGAASLPLTVKAVVSKGGRPDMVSPVLKRTRAATLLIAGELDEGMIPPHRDALAELGCEKKLVVVPGASQLFEEAGAQKSVERLARDWFSRFLCS